LQELVKTNRSADEIAALFRPRGLPVEEQLRTGEALGKAIVAEVVSVQTRTVTLFDGGDVIEVEAPTSRLAPDVKVAFSPETKSIVTEQQVGIEGSNELVQLPASCEIGSLVRGAVDDEILVVELPPNRGDLTGIVGIARELACCLEQEFTPARDELSEATERVRDCLALEVKDTSDTPDYIARMVRGVKIASSPFWLKWRLLACGIRPISNVVDATNYILFKYGQPLHAFDYARLAGRKLITRRATAAETITTIDGVLRRLNENVLVIADQQRPVAVAGIMGGRETEIGSATRDVVIECARFAPAVIRRGSRALGLATEASQRFEVGIDADAMDVASREAAALMQALCGGTVLAGTCEVRTPIAARAFDLSWERTNRLLGLELAPEQMAGILRRLGFKVNAESGMRNVARVSVPSFRGDIETAADLAEEIGRIAGYDRIPSDETYTSREAGSRHEQSLRRARIGRLMLGLGFDEVQTISLVSEAVARQLAPQGPVLLLKPLNERYAALRPSLLPSLLETVSLNLRRGMPDLRLFEINPVYSQPASPVETLKLGGVLTGAREPLFWGAREQAMDFSDAAGAIQSLFQALGIGDHEIRPADAIGFEPGLAAGILASNAECGVVGRIARAGCEQYGISEPVFGFELDWDALWRRVPRERGIQPLPRFPAVKRDYALLVGAGVTAARLRSEVRAVAGAILEQCEIFDHYQGKPLPADKRSIGIRLALRTSDRTLTATEVEELTGRLLQALRERLGAELRK
jgi:phenylalanyl-tRNA synthetase beta chain